mmetsp:Transcript_25689/g.67413  ORF Transcript_25689/g.67413 Transcript_25689/m.67413 type:complete len:101 (+) Transcript_25689:213-515(+)
MSGASAASSAGTPRVQPTAVVGVPCAAVGATPMDGNCLYHAVAAFVKGITKDGINMDHEQLRKAVSQFLAEHRPVAGSSLVALVPFQQHHVYTYQSDMLD